MAQTFELNAVSCPERVLAAGDPGPQRSPLGWAFALTLAAALLGCAGSVLSWAPEASSGAATAALDAQATEPNLWVPAATALPPGSGLVAAPVPTPAASVSVRWEGAELVIEARAAPLAKLAQALVTHTGSELLGDVAALKHNGRPLTMQWRGSDLQTAWAQLLQAQLSYASQCGGAGCRVWVLGALQADKAAAKSSAEDRAPSRLSKAPVAPDPPGLFPAD